MVVDHVGRVDELDTAAFERCMGRANIAADAVRQERLLVNNPCEISEGDARRIYEAAL